MVAMVSNSVDGQESRRETAETTGKPVAKDGSAVALDVSDYGSPTGAEDEADVPTTEPLMAVLESTPGALDGLRRTGSKIADLRKAFEKQQGDAASMSSSKGPHKQFERNAARSKDREAEISRLKDRHDAELAKLVEEHEAEVARLKEAQQHGPPDIEQIRLRCGKEEELRHAYEEKCTGLEEELEALQDRLARQDLEWQRETERQMEHLHRERNQAIEEANAVSRQLFELKRGISAATRVDHQISDALFAQDITKMYHETQNWVVNQFRKVKVDNTAIEMTIRLAKVAEARHSAYLQPVFEQYDASVKLAALQATVACYMMEIFDDPLLFGMPSQAEWRKGIKKAMDSLPAVLSPVAFNKWRATTLDAVGQSKDQEIEDAIESASRSMSEMICIALTTLTEAGDTNVRTASLNPIVQRAISLSHLFRVQRPRYDFNLPSPGSAFDPIMMEDVSVEGEPSPDAVVRFAMFPSVVKRGDEVGDNMHLANVIVKAKVLCR